VPGTTPRREDGCGIQFGGDGANAGYTLSAQVFDDVFEIDRTLGRVRGYLCDGLLVSRLLAFQCPRAVRVDPWPDSVEGLTRLRRHFTITTLSNTGMAVAVAIVKHAHLPFDAVLTAELAKLHKPAPAVYQLAVDYLGYRPDQILMVACHKYDLRAAGKFGMRTAFVARPLEFGPGVRPDIAPESWIDSCVDSFTSLADRLGAV
jgi:HAD superfamily hydrolase (TIGR01493 family)